MAQSAAKVAEIQATEGDQATADAFTAIKMLLTAPRASAHEAADGLATVVFSWQWGP